MLSCSTNNIVGLYSSSNSSICIRENTSIKLRGSSQICKWTLSHRLLAIRTFFFWPPLKSERSFSNCTLEKSSFRKIVLKRLSSRLFSLAYSVRFPNKSFLTLQIIAHDFSSLHIKMICWFINQQKAVFF